MDWRELLLGKIEPPWRPYVPEMPEETMRSSTFESRPVGISIGSLVFNSYYDGIYGICRFARELIKDGAIV